MIYNLWMMGLDVPEERGGLGIDGEEGAPTGGGAPAAPVAGAARVTGDEALADAEGDGAEADEPAEGEAAADTDTDTDDDGLEHVFGDDGLEGIRELIAEAKAAGKPFKITREEFAALDPKAKQALVNVALRAEKASKAATEREVALTEREKKAEKARLEAQRARARSVSAFRNPKIDAFLKELEAPAADTLDPLSPEGIAKTADLAYAKRQREFMAKLDEAFQAEDAEVQKMEAQETRAAELAGIRKFIEEHPEGMEPGSETRAAISKLRKAGIPLEDAYAYVMSRAALEGREDEAETMREQNRRKIRPGFTRDGLPVRPSFKSTQEEVDWYEKNPDALKAEHDNIIRRRFGNES